MNTTLLTTVTVRPAGQALEAEAGASLYDVLRGAGLMTHDCDNGALCRNRCHLFVLEGCKGLSKVQRDENEQLDQIVGVGAKSRLACKATVLGTEPVTVELLSFV